MFIHISNAMFIVMNINIVLFILYKYTTYYINNQTLKNIFKIPLFIQFLYTIFVKR